MNKLCLLLGASFAPLSPLYAAEPSDARARAPAAKYESAFENYRAHREEPLADWRALNDEVGRVGGHVGIMREEAAKTPAATGKPRDAAPAPAARGHQH